MCEFFDKIFELSAKLTDWSINSGVKLGPGRNVPGVTRYAHLHDKEEDSTDKQSFLICTGGGPGFMEAANMGAASCNNSKSIGVIHT